MRNWNTDEIARDLSFERNTRVLISMSLEQALLIEEILAQIPEEELEGEFGIASDEVREVVDFVETLEALLDDQVGEGETVH